MIGQTISHYKITEKLGEGGMGVVYKAEDTQLDRTVALKFLPESLTPTEEDRRRFIREAKAAAALNHPNICTIYNVDKHDGNQFIVMEYVEGETLRAKMDAGDLTMEIALDYAAKVAEALAAAHEQGIVHRDIKPGNIMIDGKGRIKVMDFGLAKAAGSMDLTKTGSTLGTVPYMSPEQIQGEPVDRRSDIFSLGVVLYEMLTGATPFRGEHQAAMTYAIVNEEPAPISRYLPEAPDELTQFFEKLLAKDPEDRIESASQVVELLSDMKESADILSETSQPVQTEKVKESSSDGDSSTISITLPGLGFGKKKIGWSGLLASTIGILALILFTGWWFSSGSAVNSNTTVPLNGMESEITDRSIAVLPFTNQGGGEEVASITLGLHDDLLTRLSNIGDLQIISRTSVEKFRDADLSLPLIADSLGVQWIVEGGIQEAGSQIRVNAKLVDPENGVQQWADSYQRKLTAKDLFAIQEDIAGEIANALEAELTPEERERITGAPTEDLEAYHLYVQGRRLLEQRTEKSIQEAKGYFERALKQDSSYALAWSGLADTHMLYAAYGSNSPKSLFNSMKTALPKGREASLRALELDRNLGEAHASLGVFYMYEQLINPIQKNGPRALKALKKAVDLKPSYAQAHHWLGDLQLTLGQHEPALEHLKLAVDLNPEHRGARNGLISALLANNKYEEALVEARLFREMYPDHRLGATYEAEVLVHLKQWEQVRKTVSETQEPSEWAEAMIAFADIATGDTVSARSRLEQLQIKASNSEVIPLIQAALGNVDKSLALLQEGYPEEYPYLRTYTLRYLFPDILEPLRNDPRYDELIRTINTSWGLNPDGSIPEESM